MAWVEGSRSGSWSECPGSKASFCIPLSVCVAQRLAQIWGSGDELQLGSPTCLRILLASWWRGHWEPKICHQGLRRWGGGRRQGHCPRVPGFGGGYWEGARRPPHLSSSPKSLRTARLWG